MKRALWLGFFAVVGCSPLESPDSSPDSLQVEPAVEVRRDAIVGGAVSNGDPEVFMLSMQYGGGQGSNCTATLIGPRTLLTAAHCVDPRVGGATSISIWATHLTNTFSAGNNDYIKVVETRIHPGWNPNAGLSNDIALALLERRPTGISPKPWNQASVSSFKGKPLRAVGYGTTGSGNGSGVKRTVDLTFRAVNGSHIFMGDQVGRGICHGDSGGPSFHTFPDGVERVVGVHSYTTTAEKCVDGADVRVDAYAQFINEWISSKEGAQCYHDGLCKAGCAPVDPDCACVGDGQCTAACQFPGEDPDCPRDCGDNGVCSTQTCPTPDPDCTPFGSTCTDATQCQGRQCVNDPQHPRRYCSSSCTSASDCPSGMACERGVCQWEQLPTASVGEACVVGGTYCMSGSVCAGADGATTCQKPCELTSDCPNKYVCKKSGSGQSYCENTEKPVEAAPTPTAASEPTPAQSSCAQGVGGPWLLGLGLLAGLLARRRRATVD